MLNFNIKTILKTALGVSLIYIMVILLTLLMCSRVSELDSSNIEGDSYSISLR